MAKNKDRIKILDKIALIYIGIVVSLFSFVYKKLIKKPVRKILRCIVEPILDTLDDEISGIVIIFSLLIEILILLIVPWFFNWVIGLIIFLYVTLSIYYLLIIIDDNETKKWKNILSMILITPYLILAFFPTIVMSIIRKKPEKKLTIIELRKNKLKYLKKKIRRNRFKFWKK